MTARIFLACLLSFPLALLSCSRSYVLQGPDADQAIAAVGAGGHAKHVVVKAKRIGDDTPRWVELRADDVVGVEWEEMSEGASGKLNEKWAKLSAFPAGLSVISLRYKKPQSTSDDLFFASALIPMTGYGMQLASAAWSIGYAYAYDEPQEAAHFIPYYGSILLIKQAIKTAEEECGQNTGKCIYSVYNSAHGMVSFAAQVAGPLLLITAALWPDSRERDAPEKTVLGFQSMPNISPFADGGLLLTWRF